MGNHLMEFVQSNTIIKETLGSSEQGTTFKIELKTREFQYFAMKRFTLFGKEEVKVSISWI